MSSSASSRKKLAGSPPPKAQPPTTATVAESTSSIEEPIKVSLYDASGMKTALDECAREVVIEAGYDEDHTVSNIKLTVGGIAIACALYAQFGLGKFPNNWWAALFCVVAYVILTTLLNVYLHTAEQGAFLICKPRRGQAGPGLRMSSHMERFSDLYTLILSQGKKGSPEHRETKLTASLTKFFHEDGFLCDAAFRPEVERLIVEYESGSAKKSQ